MQTRTPRPQAKGHPFKADQFRLEQPRIAGIVDQALDTPDSRWKACGRDMWITKAIQPTPPLNVIALLTTLEKERVGVRTAFDLASFCSLFPS